MKSALVQEIEASVQRTTYLDALSVARKTLIRVGPGRPAPFHGVRVSGATAFFSHETDILWFFRKGRARRYALGLYLHRRLFGYPRCDRCGCQEIEFCDEVPRTFNSYEFDESTRTITVISGDQTMHWDACSETRAECKGCGLQLDLKFDFT